MRYVMDCVLVSSRFGRGDRQVASAWRLARTIAVPAYRAMRSRITMMASTMATLHATIAEPPPERPDPTGALSVGGRIIQ
jgi:hypothetical protein